MEDCELSERVLEDDRKPMIGTPYFANQRIEAMASQIIPEKKFPSDVDKIDSGANMSKY